MRKKVLFLNNTNAYSTSSALLSKEGYDVDMEYDSGPFLKRLVIHDYDVIIVQDTPVAKSWRLCARIRRLSAAPLIVISTYASADTCVRAISAGADFFMRKPFGPLEFLARVQSLLPRAAQLSQTVNIN